MKSNTLRHLSLTTPSVQEALVLAIPVLVSSLDEATRKRINDEVNDFEKTIIQNTGHNQHIADVIRDLRFLLGAVK